MLTTDPIYFRPLLPVITIKNTANNATLYTYNSFTDSGTTDKVLYCSVHLSQNTHGEFTIQFEDQNKSLESTVTVGSRVQIDCGKQSSSLTRLISGLVRKKGYARGANSKVLYTISGTSTGIRLNEKVTYQVSEANKPDGVTVDINDASRKADTLLASCLNTLTADGILSIANLAANSDVETFIASISIEYGELQDVVNYIEDQSGGEVIVDTNDLVNFRHEIKNNLFGRGFTIKNNNDNRANDDADDTMYLINKNWSYEDDFYKSANFANRLYAILSPENRPGSAEDLGFDTTNETAYGTVDTTHEVAVKFKPSHVRHLINDFAIVAASYISTGGGTPADPVLRICEDAGGVPKNVGGVVGSVVFDGQKEWGDNAAPTPQGIYKLLTDPKWIDDANNVTTDQILLDTTRYYWLILRRPTDSSSLPEFKITWARNIKINTTNFSASHTSNFSNITDGGSGWVLGSAMPCFAAGRYRSYSMVLQDPKSVQAVQSGLGGAGLFIDSVLTDVSPQITTKESLYRHLANQLYSMARPRTSYNFSTVTAPNIPPVPGDPIVIADSVLGLSTTGNQIALTVCGDMSYQWGNMGSGSYEAPTKLSIQAIALHPRYR